MKEIDESTVSKPPRFTIDEVDESVVDFNDKNLTPRASDPLNFKGGVLIPTSRENMVIALNHTEALFSQDKQGHRYENFKSSIATQKFSELCISDYLNSKGIVSSVDSKIHSRPEDSILKTENGFSLHVKALGVSDSRRALGPAYIISKDDSVNQFLPKHYVIGCVVSNDWKELALLFCISSFDTRTQYRSTLKYMPRYRCLYHTTIRELSHDDRWGCLRNLVKQEVKNVEITDDDGLSVAD